MDPHGTVVTVGSSTLGTEDASRLFLTFADYILNRAPWGKITEENRENVGDNWWHICCQLFMSPGLI